MSYIIIIYQPVIFWAITQFLSQLHVAKGVFDTSFIRRISVPEGTSALNHPSKCESIDLQQCASMPVAGSGILSAPWMQHLLSVRVRVSVS